MTSMELTQDPEAESDQPADRPLWRWAVSGAILQALRAYVNLRTSPFHHFLADNLPAIDIQRNARHMPRGIAC